MVYIRWDQWTHTTHTHTTTEDRDGNIPQARPRSAHPGEVLDTPYKRASPQSSNHAVSWGLLQMRGLMRGLLHMGYPL